MGSTSTRYEYDRFEKASTRYEYEYEQFEKGGTSTRYEYERSEGGGTRYEYEYERFFFCRSLLVKNYSKKSNNSLCNKGLGASALPICVILRKYKRKIIFNSFHIPSPQSKEFLAA